MNGLFINALAAVSATVQPMVAQAQPGAADVPVRIASCSVAPEYELTSFGDREVPGSPAGASVWISFENRSAATATDVTLLLERPEGAVTITDSGQFSSAVPIQHRLGPIANLEGGETTCSLYSVRFDDGTVWQRP
jgi:hypothetical protein